MRGGGGIGVVFERHGKRIVLERHGKRRMDGKGKVAGAGEFVRASAERGAGACQTHARASDTC